MQSAICVSAYEGGMQGEKSQTEEHQQCIYYSMTEFRCSGHRSQQPFQVQ